MTRSNLNQSRSDPKGFLGRLTRRRLLRAGIPVAVATAVGVAGGAGFYESQELCLKEVVISVADLPHAFAGFTIAHLSDFHYHPKFTASAIQVAVQEANRHNPDITVLTGDFVTVPYFGLKRRTVGTIIAQAEPCSALLSELRPKLGTYGVLGNHDQHSQPEVVAESLERRGIRILRNQAVALQRGTDRIWLAGVDDVLEGAADLQQALRSIPNDVITILLAHEPDFADYVSQYPVAVQLSGHSHGGQIRLPLIGPPYLPELARKYPWGLRHVGDLNLYTSCGIGTIELPVRVNCPPELTLIRLNRRNA